MSTTPHRLSPTRFHRPLITLVAAASLTAAVTSPVTAQTTAPTSAPTSSPAEPAPSATEDEKVKIELELEHPVSVADAMTVADDLDVREFQYNIEGAAGGVIVTPGATAEDIQSELDKATARHGFHPPIDTVVWAVSRNVDSSSVISELSGRPG